MLRYMYVVCVFYIRTLLVSFTEYVYSNVFDLCSEHSMFESQVGHPPVLRLIMTVHSLSREISE